MRSRRLEILLTPEERTDWDEGAAAAGLSLGAYVRRCVREVRDLEKANARNEAKADRQAARLLALPPPTVRRILSRSIPEDRWPGDDAA